jgi:hypothetical protein
LASGWRAAAWVVSFAHVEDELTLELQWERRHLRHLARCRPLAAGKDPIPFRACGILLRKAAKQDMT